MGTWTRGRSGNPNGKARRTRQMIRLIREVSAEKIPFGDEDDPVVMARREALVRVLWSMALDGELAAIKLLLAYAEGKPAQTLTLEARVTGPEIEGAPSEEERLWADRERARWRQVRLELPGRMESDEESEA